MPSVLFICTGNICRSSLAEGLLRHYAKDKVRASSAGVEGYHIGEPPDPRTRHMAKSHGISLEGQKAQKVSVRLIESSDYIFAMDSSHLNRLLKLYPEQAHKIHLLLDFVDMEFDGVQTQDVLDPYYGEEGDFRAVHVTLDKAIQKLLSQIL